MTKPKILSTRPLFPAARAVLDQHFEVDYWAPAERITREELLKRLREMRGLLPADFVFDREEANER